ncbi:uncharacterized protein PV09_00985 [Verruconis gallopava]|uniref:Uncharacterized protein n=1 Tax=Verruconis gallopava TaxID=253628 RepID=A0A0D1XZ41_9PEZI|nr:uncharacterized protein PV09_00985 [Verruconis gallopava]KIW08041.1 hypothetical protein PV09_00985 [Verruconis gallopava]
MSAPAAPMRSPAALLEVVAAAALEAAEADEADEAEDAEEAADDAEAADAERTEEADEAADAMALVALATALDEPPTEAQISFVMDRTSVETEKGAPRLARRFLLLDDETTSPLSGTY